MLIVNKLLSYTPSFLEPVDSSTCSPAILIEVFRGLPQRLHENAAAVL
jgi:hypothetical protein